MTMDFVRYIDRASSALSNRYLSHLIGFEVPHNMRKFGMFLKLGSSKWSSSLSNGISL